MERPFERVYTVTDFYDVPRSGFADVDGRPHAYRSIWQEALDDWDAADRFALHPVTPELLALALEDWAIWRRWEEAYYAGRAETTSHPALPDDRARHEELAPVVAQALELDAARCRVAIGKFRTRSGVRGSSGIPTSRVELEVQWTPVE